MAKTYMIRITDTSVKKLVEAMARSDARSVGNFTAQLIRAEYERRYPAEKGQKEECGEVK